MLRQPRETGPSTGRIPAPRLRAESARRVRLRKDPGAPAERLRPPETRIRGVSLCPTFPRGIHPSVPDGGGAIAARYPDPRFAVFSQPNAGPGAARNTGIRHARGELVAVLDADDTWDPEYLESSVALLDAHPAAAAVSSGYIEYPEVVSKKPMWLARGFTDGLHGVTPETGAVRLVHTVAYMHCCTTVARAVVLRRLGGFHENHCRYAEDAALWLKVVLNEPVYFQLRALTHFHREYSDLSHPGRAHPVEPFLANLSDVLRACPQSLKPLLNRFLTVRACKTAAVLGYWGEWREARTLVRRFVASRDWRVPLFASPLAGCTPLAGLAGAAWRSLRPAATPAPAPVPIPEALPAPAPHRAAAGGK